MDPLDHVRRGLLQVADDALVGALVVDVRTDEVAGEEVADDPQRQLRLLVDEHRRRRVLGPCLDRLPEALQEDEVALDVLGGGAVGGGADDDAALFHLELLDDLLQARPLRVVEASGDAQALAVRDVDEEPAGKRDLRRQARALRLHRVLHRLDEQLLAARDQVLDLLPVPLALELRHDDLVDVEEPVLLEADLDERSFHARKHVVDDAEVDVPGDRASFGPLQVDLGDPVVLDHGDPLLADVDRDQELTLGGGQRCPSRRLPAALRAALRLAAPIGSPLGALAARGLVALGLAGLLRDGSARVGGAVGRRALPATTATAAAAALVAGGIGCRCRTRIGAGGVLRELRLSRSGSGSIRRDFVCRDSAWCALGRLLRVVVLLPLPSEPGQVVPLLVVARAGAWHPTGIPASRSGCRNSWPWSQGLAVQGISAGGEAPSEELRTLPTPPRGAAAPAGRGRHAAAG